jgi:hypothetical protein
LAKAFRVAEQRLRVRDEVMPDGYRLSTLQMCVTRHDPSCMGVCLDRKGGNRPCDLGYQLTCRRAAVEPEIERHLVVARATGVQ